MAAESDRRVWSQTPGRRIDDWRGTAFDFKGEPRPLAGDADADAVATEGAAAWGAAVETAGTPDTSPITEATLDLIGVGPDGQMERLGSSEEFTADDTWQEVDITAVCAAFLARRGEAWRTMFGMVGVGEYDATAPYAFQAITFAEVSQRTGSNGTEVYLFEGTSNQYAYANPSAVLGDWALTFRPTGGLLSAVLPTTRGVPRQLHGMV